MQKIILVGYMAVGKSTIGKILAEKRQMKWVDLDEIIENDAKLSVTEIFKQKGEIYFRKQEHLEFQKLISSEEKLIISTGGGTPCYANNHLLFNGPNIISIYLKAGIAELYNRLKENTATRPLVVNQSEEELKEFIAKNLFDRSYYYNQATFTINTDGKSPETIAAEIENLLH
jgi:shikimate kinase